MDSIRKILVVDSDANIRNCVAEILALSMYKVYTAENGKKGIEIALSTSPDLVLCDITMPELDGYGVLYMMQRNPSLCNIPFIFLSSKGESCDIKRGLSLGADDYITKPFDAADLLSRVEYRIRKTELLKKQFSGKHFGTTRSFDVADGDRALKSFAQYRSVTRFKRRELIFHEGGRPSHIYFLKKGRVKVFKKNADDKELIVRIVNEGDFFGYIALLQDTNYEASAETLDACEIALIPRVELEELMNSNPEVSRKFIKLLTRDILQFEEQLIQIAYNSLRRKVADALLNVYAKCKSKEEKQSFSISRENLAAITGTAPESVIRTLGDFKSENLIDLNDGKISLLDLDRIHKLVN